MKFFQSLILLWSLCHSLNVLAVTPSTESSALSDLYFALDGANWFQSTNWFTGDCCDDSWYGITCVDISGTTHVQQIRLESNGLSGDVPMAIGDFPELTYLFLHDNEVLSLPNEIGYLNNLLYLYMQNNNLTSLPETIGSLSSVLRIDFEYNQITSVPDSIGDLSTLQYLDLGPNELTSLPSTLSQLSNLQDLGLEGNALTEFPAIIGLTSLLELNLHKNNIGSIPADINTLTSLQQLWCNACGLTSLPDELGDVSTLETLYVHDNALTELPSTLASLVNLVDVDIGYNDLTSLPAYIGEEWSKLDHLNCRSNILTSLPSTLSQLKHLRQLQIQYNVITSIPDPFAASMDIFTASYNQLTTWPTAIAAMTNLTYLAMEGNGMTGDMGVLPDNLVTLDIRGNELTGIFYAEYLDIGSCRSDDDNQFFCLSDGTSLEECGMSTCVISSCDSAPCMNNGVCTPDTSVGYVCACPEGWIGPVCNEVDDGVYFIVNMDASSLNATQLSHQIAALDEYFQSYYGADAEYTMTYELVGDFYVVTIRLTSDAIEDPDITTTALQDALDTNQLEPIVCVDCLASDDDDDDSDEKDDSPLLLIFIVVGAVLIVAMGAAAYFWHAKRSKVLVDSTTGKEYKMPV